jgi:glyoxylase-like metal-dependent hydrolase (beta-lactamase superfamily II)
MVPRQPTDGRIGSVRLHVLDLGRLQMDASLLVAGDPPGVAVQIPVPAYVIEHPDGNILFDTGCHPRAMGDDGLWPPEYQRDFPWSGTEANHLLPQLAALGLDISTVVLSHLHNDHSGGVEFFDTPLIVNADELAAAYAATDDSSYVRAETAIWRAKNLNWQPIRSDLRLNDAVTVLNWGSGHAAGMLGLHVRLPSSGDIILASDALYCAANYAPDFRLPGLLVDAAGCAATARHIAALARQFRADVWFGHDATQFASLVGCRD